MIQGYLRQTAKWKKMTSTGGYPPQPEATGTEIAVRWEAKRRLVRNPQGQEVISEARVFCKSAVQPGDILEFNGRNWPVLAVSETPGLDGVTYFREVSV